MVRNKKQNKKLHQRRTNENVADVDNPSSLGDVGLSLQIITSGIASVFRLLLCLGGELSGLLTANRDAAGVGPPVRDLPASCSLQPMIILQ